MTEDKKIAVFFDAENISSKYFAKISAKINSYGDILVQRAYADWSMDNSNGWENVVRENPVQAIQQFHSRKNEDSKKNETANKAQDVDKAIIMDGVEISIKNPEINTICLVASDKGYSDFVLKLRSLGKYVLGIGEKKSGENSLYVKTFNEFIYIEDLLEVEENILTQIDKKKDEGLKDFALEKFISQCFEQTTKNGDETVLLSRLGDTILRQKSDFNYRDFDSVSLVQLLEKISKSSDEYSYEIKKYEKPGLETATRKLKSSEVKPEENSYVDRLEENLLKEKEIKGEIFKCIGNFGFVRDETDGEYYYYRGDAPKVIQEKLRKNAKVVCKVTKEPDSKGVSTKDRNGRVEILALDESCRE